MKFRTFNQDDWCGYAGAERLGDSEPLISYDDKVYIAIIDGASWVPGYVGIKEDSEKFLHAALTFLDLRREDGGGYTLPVTNQYLAHRIAQALGTPISELELKHLGFHCIHEGWSPES